jgi:hypothetical protein
MEAATSRPSDDDFKEIRPARVRYIKLGEGGRWEAECIAQGIVRFGFETANSERFQLCRDGRWPELTASFLAAGHSKGTATRFTNEARWFFEDDGSTLLDHLPRRQPVLGLSDAGTR